MRRATRAALIIDDLAKKPEFRNCRSCPERPRCKNDECELGTREREELSEAFPRDVVSDVRTCLALRQEYPPPGLFGVPKRRRWPKRWNWNLLQTVRIVDNEAFRYETDQKNAKSKEKASGDRS